MNQSRYLGLNAQKYLQCIDRLYMDAFNDRKLIDRYSIVSVSQLNNLLRTYFFSINDGAFDAHGNFATLGQRWTRTSLIDEIVRIGNPRVYKNKSSNHIWGERDEPAYHSPKVFLRLAKDLGCSKLPEIQIALNDSWKIDVLRSTRNYFAHRCRSLEDKAIDDIAKKYAVSGRISNILFQRDAAIYNLPIDDIHNYLKDFVKKIS